MEKLILKIKADHPGLVFATGTSHCWSPEHGKISYDQKMGNHSVDGLLHELGHARLGHEHYTNDIELLQKEVDAWEEALRLAQLYDVTIDENHLQDCLDTYRDWLHKRSRCPKCKNTGLQESEHQYTCLNCEHSWRVTTSRFCRPYRIST